MDDLKLTIPSTQNKRILSGIRPTGRLHLGHYHGLLKNLAKLQYEYECFYMVADYHMLTTEYEKPLDMHDVIIEMVTDWLAAGVSPAHANLFVQSWVPEHAELHLLLSMMAPLGWLERMPTYKDQQLKLKDKDLHTYGFLGYPVLQAADVLIYKAGWVPVGEDQVPHIEMARELARRFNFLYGREEGYEAKAEAAITKMGKKNIKLYRTLQKQYQEQGDHQALETGRALIDETGNLVLSERERLLGYLEGSGRIILTEPQALLTQHSRFPGLDGQKMSKSYHNTIGLRESPKSVEEKIRTMPTDPARVRRSDPGDPEKCPVWGFHKVYSDSERQEWVQKGCRSAGIGCIDCKKPVIQSILDEQQVIRDRAKEYENNPALVRNILSEGTAAARTVAKETMEEVREAMGLDYV
jgi:tryptophanyl-tRNA synthetase